MKHLIFSSKLFAILFVFSSMMYIGCQKEEIKINKSQAALSTEVRTSVTPTEENGTLKFENEADAIAYYNELKLLSSSSEGFNFNSLNLPGFNSLASTDAYTDVMNNSFKFFDDEYAFLLNTNYEVIIGNEIRVQKSLKEYLKIGETDIANRDLLRSIPPGEIIDIKDINDNIEVVGKERQIFKLDPVEVLAAPPLGCECRVVITNVEIQGIAVPGRYIFNVHCKGISGTPTVTINFGDGTTTPGTISSARPVFLFDKTYAQGTGQLNVTVTVNLPCGTFSSTRILNPSDNCCSNFYNSGWREKCEGSDCIRYSLQVFNNNLGVRSSQAKLYSIRNLNGVYSNPSTALLKIDMESTWRFCEIVSICDVQSIDSTVKECSSCKNAKETHNNYNLFSDPDCNKTGDVYARYKRNVAGVGLIEAELSAIFCN